MAGLAAGHSVAQDTNGLQPGSAAGGGGAPQIVVGLPSGQETARGQIWVAPNVNVTRQPGSVTTSGSSEFRPSIHAEDVGWEEGFSRFMQASARTTDNVVAAEPLPAPSAMLGEGEMPIFEDLLAPELPPDRPRNWLRYLFSSHNHEAGVGRERLPFALSEIDPSQPFAHWRMRVNSVRNQSLPDRAEFLWAKMLTGRGPKLPETGLDYQEYRLQFELGNKKFSTATELPIRWTNPEVNPNHTGFSDMSVATKTVLFDGETYQITQFFKTYFPTGSASMGTGTGHFAIEPGFLGRMKWSDVTFLNAELKYYVPLGGDPIASGQVLKYGVGYSHVFYDSDKVALLPTMEFVGWSVLNGLGTNELGISLPVDGQHIMTVVPGLRLAIDRGCELGLLEFGISGILPVSDQQFFDNTLRFDFRWSY